MVDVNSTGYQPKYILSRGNHARCSKKMARELTTIKMCIKKMARSGYEMPLMSELIMAKVLLEPWLHVKLAHAPKQKQERTDPLVTRAQKASLPPCRPVCCYDSLVPLKKLLRRTVPLFRKLPDEVRRTIISFACTNNRMHIYPFQSPSMIFWLPRNSRVGIICEIDVVQFGSTKKVRVLAALAGAVMIEGII